MFLIHFRTLYDNQEVEAKRIENCMIKFLTAVKGKLKSKSLDRKLSVEFHHDIFRHTFRGKGYQSNVSGVIMLNIDDFERLMLPDSWYYTLDKHGEGHCIEFPIRAKPILRKSSKDFTLIAGVLIQSPRYIFEMVTLYITKRPCSKDSLQ